MTLGDFAWLVFLDILIAPWVLLVLVLAADLERRCERWLNKRGQ